MTDRRSFIVGAAAGLSILVFGMTSGRSAEAKVEQAKQFVRELVDQAISILELPEDDTIGREASILELLETRFDLPTITRLVLGRYWRKASADQRKSFAEVFKTHIVKVYNSQLGLYDNEEVVIKQVTPLTESDTVIFTEIMRLDDPSIRVDWRVRDKEGALKVVDVASEGVSLVTTKRSEYSSVLAREGIDTLIAKLDELNARNGDPNGDSLASE